jgi:eukaryotic-like serine/threonine-protein kinase
VSAAPTILGRYALFGEIAAGGMATVRIGRLLGPVGFSRTVAIKQLHASLAKDPDFVAMMLDEARLAARIHHPNVVVTLDVVAEGEELLVVMEYVQGESLARLAAAGPLPVGVAVSVVAGALHGLHAAHEAKSEHGRPLGIVHRDVSPHNILVGTDGIARVGDFGVAKAIGRMQMTRTGQVKGKAAYMAPEQLSAGDVDARADVYSAAVVLWEALTGKRLFARDNEIETLRAATSLEVPPPSRLRSGVSEELDAIVLRGLCRARDGRFPTARDMAIALEDAVALPRAHEIGAWVEETALAALRARAETVALVEGATGIAVGGEPSPATRPRFRRALAAALAVAAMAGIAAGVHRARRNDAPPITASAPKDSAVPEPPSASVEAPLVTMTATPPEPVRSAPPRPGPPRARTTARPPGTCDPPFTVDATGVKIPKRECLTPR